MLIISIILLLSQLQLILLLKVTWKYFVKAGNAVNNGYKYRVLTELCAYIIYFFPLPVRQESSPVYRWVNTGRERWTNCPVIQLVSQEPGFKSVSLNPQTFHKVTHCFLINDVINFSGCIGTLIWCLREAINVPGHFHTSSRGISYESVFQKRWLFSPLTNPVKDIVQ